MKRRARATERGCLEKFASAVMGYQSLVLRESGRIDDPPCNGCRLVHFDRTSLAMYQYQQPESRTIHECDTPRDRQLGIPDDL